MNPSTTEMLGTGLFAIAVLHTFAVSRFQTLAARYPEGTVAENFFHFMGEVEVVFGLWAALLVTILVLAQGKLGTVNFLESLDFKEPMFVFVVMALSATRPLRFFTEKAIGWLARAIPLPKQMATFVTIMSIGPLMGSFITEPAAMTVTALLLKDHFFDRGLPERLKYCALGTLFVNVSIGGVMTHFAAPPVLMVASRWNWNTPYMFQHFGWKALIAVLVNAGVLCFVARKELSSLWPVAPQNKSTKPNPPLWLVALHGLLLTMVVMNSHHPVAFVGIFLLFLGLAEVTDEYQDPIKIRESLLVACFLGGLVVLGSFQRWWLQPILASLTPFPLYLGATALTAIVDNAALTYLGSQVSNLSEALKYALVAGSVAGGGLTVIANAPNPAGYSILKHSFGPEGIRPLRLLSHSLVPTLIAMAGLWLL